MQRLLIVLLILAAPAVSSADTAQPIMKMDAVSTAASMPLPWTVQIKQKHFQWKILGWWGLVSLAIGTLAGLYALILIALPASKTGLLGKQRGVGFIAWLVLSALFVFTALGALLFSIGHNSLPETGPAFPFYFATFMISLGLLALALVLRRKRRG